MIRNSNMLVRVVLMALLTASVSSFAIEPREFENHDQRILYLKLTEELRCLVCQNQNIADSDAELAGDLRQEVYEMVIEDQQDAEIKKFLVDRYGDFVLYRPPLQKNTMALWIMPVILALIALFAAVFMMRGSASRSVKDSSRDAVLAEIEDEEP